MSELLGINRSLKLLWGEASALLHQSRRVGWIDVMVLFALFGILALVIGLAQRWTGVLRPTVEIDLSPWALPKYALYSLSRGLIAYAFSLTFTLIYGYWAAKDARAGKVLIPLLDILQSVPVLGFMPSLILALVAIFPTSNIGLELAAVIMMFTGQAWNMTFSFYHSLKSVPTDQIEAATIYRFSWWQKFKWVELPFSAIGLIWNSMMSMAGGWFFLMITEQFVLKDRDFRLPGIGSYMSVAVAKGDVQAMLLAIAAMTAMIILLDQLLWRPVVVWGQKFKIEEGAEEAGVSSWFLDWLRKSSVIEWLVEKFSREEKKAINRIEKQFRRDTPLSETGKAPQRTISTIAILLLGAAVFFGAWKVFFLLKGLTGTDWLTIGASAFATMARVLSATLLGTLWALPVGMAIGLNPRLSRILQPVVQVCASFPAPMLFPAAIALLAILHVSLGFGSIVLMLLGTQWYILFNVIAGAMAIPTDLREAARSYRITGRQRFLHVYLPAVFPYLITGWVTAAGGGWNASIVAEYVLYKGSTFSTFGLGSTISRAATDGNYPVLSASILVMAIFVVIFNRSVWRRLYTVAQTKFSLVR